MKEKNEKSLQYYEFDSIIIKAKYFTGEWKQIPLFIFD